MQSAATGEGREPVPSIGIQPFDSVSFEVGPGFVDSALPEVMRGFGALKRRGAEVGGILLGRCRQERGPDGQTKTVFTLDRVEFVACRHERGPSYILGAPEKETLQTALGNLARHQASDGFALQPLGFLRSNTRDVLELDPSDRELLAEFFGTTPGIICLVKPHAFRPADALCYMPRIGDGAAFHFTLVRSHAPTGAPPESRNERRTARESAGLSPTETPLPFPEADIPSDYRVPGFAGVEPTPERSWRWLLAVAAVILTFALGAASGYLGALSGLSVPGLSNLNLYGLGLRVTSTEDNLRIQWERQSMLIRNSPGGFIVIQDGTAMRRVDLDAGQLRNGSVVYRRVNSTVVVHLNVFRGDRAMVGETVRLSLPAIVTDETTAAASPTASR